MSQYAVSFKYITKQYPGVAALDRVSLQVAAGTIHGLVGENGAGKSTLGKILAGIEPADSGKIQIDGKTSRIRTPCDAKQAGVGIVHQELSFCENLSVAENLCLEALPTRGPFVSHKQMTHRANELLEATGARIDPARRISELSISQQQLVQVAAAVGSGAHIIIFDEPTSSLSNHETQRLLQLIRQLSDQHVTSIFISHRLDEIFQLCQTVTVLRDGKVVATQAIDTLDQDRLVELMVGRKLEAYFPKHVRKNLGRTLLSVERLSSPGNFKDIRFTLHQGEVIGIAGLVGAGRSEVAQALFGLDAKAHGSTHLNGQRVEITSPAVAMRHGIGLLPEDRKRHGLVLSMSALANATLPSLGRISRLGWINHGKERRTTMALFGRMKFNAPNVDTPAITLSGGNQQKIILARWLATQCQVLILDEPTRGIDVAAKAEIHALIGEMASKGNGVILISSDLPEIINLSTRILVMRSGRMVGELEAQDANQQSIMRLMSGLDAA